MKRQLSEISDTQPRREHGNISDLKKSIEAVGLISPLTIDETGGLLAGRRRFQAVKELGWEEVDCYVLPTGGDQLKAFRVAIDENQLRKKPSEVERAVAMTEYDDLRRRLEGERKPGGAEGVYQTLVDGEGWSQAKTAEDFNVSQQTVSRNRAVATAIEEYPELAKFTKGQRVLDEYKRRQVGDILPPAEKYRAIVIDPPWPIEKILREERPNQYDFDYPTMNLEEIKTFPLQKFAFEDGAHIYLWTTQKFLPVAFDVFKEWGVNYECLLTWVKNVGFTPFSWMYSTEHCLFGRIGNLPLLKLGKRLDFAAKVREHSRKPDEFYNLVREVSPEPRIDLFSRESHEGFERWGNEPNKY